MVDLYCLHGFLGRPDDWRPLQLESIPSVNPIYVDLFNNPKLPQVPLWEWADHFNAFAAVKESRPMLMGYSMGGRLALHALLKNPKAYQGAVIISANPGLASADAKRQRLERDETWARAFEQEPWDTVLKRWNAQAVFLSDDVIPRRKEDYSKAALAKALREWSLGVQDDFKASLAEVDLPILWCVGELDHPYRQIAESLTFRNPRSNVWIAEETGHRLPWQNRIEFHKRITNFIHLEVANAYRD